MKKSEILVRGSVNNKRMILNIVVNNIEKIEK